MYSRKRRTLSKVRLGVEQIEGLPPSPWERAGVRARCAQQCPMRGGNAVFRARALYSLVNDSLSYEDDRLCDGPGLERSMKVPVLNMDLRIVPNPTRDEAVLEYVLPEGTQGQLLFFDPTGRRVRAIPVQGGVSRTVFSVLGMSNGLYHFSLTSGGDILGEGKLTVVR